MGDHGRVASLTDFRSDCMTYRFALLLLGMLLTACGGGPPSEADLRGALERNLAATIQAGEKLQGAAWAEQMRQEAKVYGLKSSGCQPEGKGYRCDIEVDWTTPLAPRAQQEMKLLLYRGSQGWTVGDGSPRN
jgi:hypothetical protein